MSERDLDGRLAIFFVDDLLLEISIIANSYKITQHLPSFFVVNLCMIENDDWVPKVE